jgi:mannosyltransferase
MTTRGQPGTGAHAPTAPLSAVREFASAHALALIVALAAVLRFATLGVPAYWLDEWTTVTETDGAFGAIADAVRDVEGAPPLYFVVLWAWQKVFGGGEIAIRSLSALLGTATVPVAYAAARELASRRAGLFAAALTATSPLLIWYSQEVRAYSLFAFLSALSLLFFIHALRSEEPRWLWGWAAASGLALATHYFALALIVPEAIWLLLRARAPRAKAIWACAGVGAVGLALLPLVVEQRERVADFIATLDRSDRLLAVPQHFVVGLSVPWSVVPLLVGLAVLAAVAYALRRADPPSRRAFALAAGVGVAGMLITVVPAVLGHDYIMPRYMVELWLPFAVAIAVALGVRAIGRLGPALVVALCVIGVALSTWNAATPEARRVSWDDVARALGEPQQKRVVAAPGYYVGVGLSLYLDGAHLAGKDERIAAPELALLWMRPVRKYGIGVCSWGAVCGGHAPGGPGPPFRAPPQFKLVRQGSTPRVTYRIYRAPTPVRLPSPEPGQVVIVQEPG